MNEGEDSLDNKKKPGNPLAKYSRRKNLSKIESLEYENMKLRIENERLKKVTWWKELNRYEIDRLELEKLIKEIHNKKPSYGYRRINRIIVKTTGWVVSDNLVHKVCKCLLKK